MKTLTVTFLPFDYRPQFDLQDKGKEYKVAQVVQTTEFVPGQYLSKVQVQDLCDMPKQWKVVIKGLKS